MKKLSKLVLVVLLLCITQTNAQENVSDRKVRFSFEMGYAYQLGKISENTPKELEAYAKKLKSGLNLEAHFSYFVKPQWGLGMVLNNFRSSNTINFTSPINVQGTSANSTSDKLNFTYVAPEFVIRSISSNEKHSLLSSFSIGYLKYKDSATINSFGIAINGATVGYGLGLQYDYHITPSIAIGGSMNLIGGTLSKIEVAQMGTKQDVKLPDEERINMGRINLNAGFRFYL